MPKIVVDGKSYSSINEMPPAVRQAYEQALGILAGKNQNSVSDIVKEVLRAENTNDQIPSVTLSSTQFIVDGKAYSNVDELPPEARQKYTEALEKIKQVMGNANQNGMPDILESALQDPSASPMPSATLWSADAPSRSAPDSVDSMPSVFDETPKDDKLLWSWIGILIVILVGHLSRLSPFSTKRV